MLMGSRGWEPPLQSDAGGAQALEFYLHLHVVCKLRHFFFSHLAEIYPASAILQAMFLVPEICQ